MTTVTVDESTKKALEQLADVAREEQRPEGELLSKLVANYRLRKTLSYLQGKYGPKARALGLKTDDDIVRFANESA